MKILVVNGNTTEAITRLIEAEANAVASPGVEICAVTAGFGPSVIGGRAENAIAQHAVLDAIARHAAGADAVLIAVSLDTALMAAREMLEVPVVGMTEAALLTACMLGGRFGMVVFDRRLAPAYAEVVGSYGLQARVAGVRIIDVAPASAAGRRGEMQVEVGRAAIALAEEAGAEAVIAVGAVAAGMARQLRDSVPVPLLDGIACAVLQAELLVRLDTRPASVGSLARADSSALTGVSEPLAAWLRSRT